MRPAELGFLLLAQTLGDPNRKPLTTYQLRTLFRRMDAMPRTGEDRELEERDLTAIGYGREDARHIVELLSQQELLAGYLGEAIRHDCTFTTRISPTYPAVLKNKLGPDAPSALWLRGDPELLDMPMVSLVGSRDLNRDNREFARLVGQNAAKQGYALVSGNARGADQTAQEAALEAGGRVICVVADSLIRHEPRPGVLYISENGIDESFSAQRAHSRNRVIHCLGQKVFVAQTTLETGGTWHGTQKNLQKQWTPVYGFDDGSRGMEALAQMGMTLIRPDSLSHISGLTDGNPSFF